MFLGIARRTALLYGVGNHVWPNSRHSAGLFAVTAYANKHRYTWTPDPHLQADIARSPLVPHIILARPTCYLQKNVGVVLERVMKSLKVDSDDLTVVHHDETVPVGAWKAELGEAQKYAVEATLLIPVHREADVARSAVRKLLVDKQFRRFAVGVGKDPKDLLSLPAFSYREDWEPRALDIFLANKMTPAEDKLFQRAVADMLTYWHGEGYADYRKTHPPPTKEQLDAAGITPEMVAASAVPTVVFKEERA